MPPRDPFQTGRDCATKESNFVLVLCGGSLFILSVIEGLFLLLLFRLFLLLSLLVSSLRLSEFIGKDGAGLLDSSHPIRLSIEINFREGGILDSESLVIEPFDTPEGLNSGSSVRESASNEQGNAERMTWSTVIFTTITQIQRHHEDRIEALLLFLHVLELIYLGLISDRLDVLNRGELSVLFTSSVNKHWLIHSQFVNAILPLGKGTKLYLLMDGGLGDLYGSIVVVELIAHHVDCCCLYPI